MSNFPVIAGFTGTLSDALSKSKVNETQTNSGADYLNLNTHTGNWTAGQEQDDVSGDLILVNTASLRHGWTIWSGNKPYRTHVSFIQDMPMAPEPMGSPQKPDMPEEARSFLAAFEDGVPCEYDTCTMGGREGVDVLFAAVKAHAASGSEFLYPKCRLANASYPNKHRGGKLMYTPVFEVVAWCDVDGNEEGGKAKAVTKQETKAEPAAETEPEAVDAPAEPVRRRRRAPAA